MLADEAAVKISVGQCVGCDMHAVTIDGKCRTCCNFTSTIHPDAVADLAYLARAVVLEDRELRRKEATDPCAIPYERGHAYRTLDDIPANRLAAFREEIEPLVKRFSARAEIVFDVCQGMPIAWIDWKLGGPVETLVESSMPETYLEAVRALAHREGLRLLHG